MTWQEFIADFDMNIREFFVEKEGAYSSLQPDRVADLSLVVFVR